MATTEVHIGGNAQTPDPAALEDQSNLTRAQFLMWLGQRIEPTLPLYNMIQTFRINGAVRPALFEAAWIKLVSDCDVLRTTIEDSHGVPMRRVGELPPPPLEVVDLRGNKDPEAAAARWIDDRKTITLDLRSRLWDTALILVTDDVAIWYLCKHHLITDGQAFAAIYQAMADRYALALEDRLDQASALTQYEDYVAYEKAAVHTPGWERSVGYWDSITSTETDRLDLYGGSAGTRSARTDRVVFDIDRERAEKIRAVAQTEGFRALTPDLSLHAVWATVLTATLHRASGVRSLRLGTPFLGRPNAAFRDTVGLFIEIGAVNANVEDDDTFDTLGRRVLSDVVRGLMNARPGTSSAATNRSYEVLINSVTSRFEPFAGHEVEADWVHTGYGDPDHALRLQVTDFNDLGRFRLMFDVNADRFDEDKRTLLVDHFDAVLDAFLTDVHQPLGRFDLLTADQRAVQIEAFNRTAAYYPQRTVIDLFGQQVTATPNAVAVEDDDGAVTYRELSVLADGVAETLTGRGIGPGHRVGVCTGRSRQLVSALLGVMSTGAAYVPIDPAFPTDRRQLIAQDAELTVMLVDGNADPLVGVELIEVPTGAAALPAVNASTLDDLAYLIYTSGSTGRPKAAMLTHRGLTNYLWWAKGLYQDERPLDFALYSSISFDLTITSLFVPLISGGRIVTYDNCGDGAGLEILDVFDQDRVDIVKLTPAHLAMVLEHGTKPERLGRLIVGGENFRTDLARRAETLFPNGVQIFNEYGPTEAVVGCMVHRFDADRDTGPSVPIGTPAANVAIHVLDDYDRPTPPGVVGELVITGDGVADGYWKRPDLTAERFADNLMDPDARSYRTGDLARWGPDGQLEFLGRDDGQVKIRGARIELGEIEAALVSHPDVGDVVVQVIEAEGPADGEIHHCVTCGLPSNHPGSDFDEDGVCGDCRRYERHRHEVNRYWRTPADLADALAAIKTEAARTEPARTEPVSDSSAPADCVVLVSGGKDSTYMLYQLVKEYGVRPLVFTLDNGYLSDAAIDNVRSACADLGVELHIATTPHMNAIFTDSLERHANVCDGCFKTVYTLSMNLARQRGIRTIVTGLARGQLFETRLADSFAAGEFDPDRIDRWIMEARKAYHHIDDAVHQLLEQDLFADDAIFDDIGFIDFYRYVDVGLAEVYRYLDDRTVWTRPADTGRSTNCLINDVGIHVHKQTRGYHNYALPYSWDVRLGHKVREVAMDELDDDIDVDRVEQIMDEIGFTPTVQPVRSHKRLVAYHVPANPQADSQSGIQSGNRSGQQSGSGSAELRRHLSRQLPDFMVPTHFVELAAIPLTVNGKVDRRRLPDPGQARPELETPYVAPTSSTQRRLAEIWSAALGIPDVGLNDNFFDLGGDSITSIQIVTAAADVGLKLSARDIFANQTVAELASVTEALPPTFDSGADADSGSADNPASEWTRPRLDELVSAEDLARIDAQLADSGGIEGADDIYPMTSTQLGMLYHALGSGGTEVYAGQAACRFDGPFDADRFRAAWDRAIADNPGARARFLWTGLDTPVQVIQRDPEFVWEHHDLTGRAESTVDAALAELEREHGRRGIDLAGRTLMDFALVVTDDGTHFLWNSHHALLDGWSAHLLFNQALENYHRPDRTEASPTGSGHRPASRSRFGDHVAALLARNPEPARAWWNDQLLGVEEATALPVSPPTPGATPVHRSATRLLDAASTSDIEAFLRGSRLTLNSLMTAAWAVVLGSYAGTDDVLFGTTVSGREDTVADAEHTVGMFITTLPTRIRLNDLTDRTVAWLQAIQDDALSARHHGHLPLAELQRLAGIDSSQPMFDSLVVVENHPRWTPGPDAVDELAPTPLRIAAPSNYALSILVHPGSRLGLEAVVDEDRLDLAMADRLLGHLEAAIGHLLSGRSPAEMDLLSAEERDDIERWEHGPPTTGLDDTTGPPIHEQILAQARRLPASVAVTAADRTLTYRALSAEARALARTLTERGLEPGGSVGVVTGDDASVIVAVVATLSAGGVYVPIDPDLPAARLGHMAAETEMRLVLAPEKSEVPAGLEHLRFVATDGRSVDRIPNPFPESGSSDATSIPHPCRPDDPAYVIYTSGSTAAPKGVVVTHGNLAYSTGVRDQVYGGGVDTFLLLSPLAFDSSMVGLFWTLATGGNLVLAGADRRSVPRIAQLIEQHSVSHLLALPSLYSLLLDESSGGLSSLQTVMVAGEACPAAVIARHRAHGGQARLFNEYGPTETTVWSHVARIDEFDHNENSENSDRTDGADNSEGSAPPIGGPIPGGLTRVCDHLGRRVPVGVAGQLWIGGPGVAAGYVKQPELTTEAFRVDPGGGPAGPAERTTSTGDGRWYRTGDLVRWRPDGQLDYLGRADSQVKIRGHRIEPAAVEAAMMSVPGVAESVCSVDVVGGRRRLVAYYTGDTSVTAARIRTELATELPGYMVPVALAHLDQLPLTRTGKVDRNNLPPIAATTAGVDGRRSELNEGLERRIGEIWQRVIGAEHVDRTSDFFELGGNSIDAMRMLARVEQLTGRALPLEALLRAPTIAEVAELIGQPEQRRENGPLVAVEPAGFKRPFFYVMPYQISIVEMARMGRHFDPDRPLYGLQPSGLSEGEEIDSTIEAMAARYITHIKAVQPRGPYLLGGHCDGGWITCEMASQLRDGGDQVDYVGLTDVPPPQSEIPGTGTAALKAGRLRRYLADGRLRYAVQWKLRLWFQNKVLLRVGPPAWRRTGEVRRVHRDAFANYRFRHDNRWPLHLIRSTELAGAMDEISWYGELRRGNPSVTVTDITSTHAKLLMDPETAELAAALSDGLDRSDD